MTEHSKVLVLAEKIIALCHEETSNYVVAASAAEIARTAMLAEMES